MSQHTNLRRIGVTNGLKTTNFVANPTLTTSYNLTLPSSTPTQPGQSLISDTLGNLAWGSSVGTVSTFTGTTNPVTTPTTLPGLLFTAPSTSTSIYVAINGTTNIYSLYNLKVYQKGSSSNWACAYDVLCDTDDVDPNLQFSITTAGQVQYIMNTVPGFSSLNMMWTLGTSVSNNLTSLALSSTLNVGGLSTFTAGIQGTSLALSSTLNVTGLATHAAMTGLSLLLGNSNNSGAVSSTVGTLLNVQSQTYTDTGTAASSTAGGSFSGTYLGIPTLAATNTAVTTGTASTLTIAGAPVAGTNETITNAYALNVVNGNSLFGGTVSVNTISSSPSGLFLTGSGGIVDSGLISIQYTAPSISGMSGNTNYFPVWTFNSSTSKFPSTVVPGGLVDGSGRINIPGSGFWRIVVDFYWQNVSSATGNGAFAVYFLGPKTIGGTPTSSGFLAMQLVYEQYFTGATTISAGYTVLNYSGGSIVNLVMNISRIFR